MQLSFAGVSVIFVRIVENIVLHGVPYISVAGWKASLDATRQFDGYPCARAQQLNNTPGEGRQIWMKSLLMSESKPFRDPAC